MLPSKGDHAFHAPRFRIEPSYRDRPCSPEAEMGAKQARGGFLPSEKMNSVTHVPGQHSRHLLLKSLGLRTAPSLRLDLRTGSTLAL